MYSLSEIIPSALNSEAKTSELKLADAVETADCSLAEASGVFLQEQYRAKLVKQTGLV